MGKPTALSGNYCQSLLIVELILFPIKQNQIYTEHHKGQTTHLYKLLTHISQLVNDVMKILRTENKRTRKPH